MAGSILQDTLIYLGSALVFVPIAKKLGIGSVLGYILAGIAIGPFVLGFVGKEGEDVMHTAEFGVVMMLFLIGLELNPQAFWKMRRTITGLGGLQVLGTIALLFPVFWLGMAFSSRFLRNPLVSGHCRHSHSGHIAPAGPSSRCGRQSQQRKRGGLARRPSVARHCAGGGFCIHHQPFPHRSFPPHHCPHPHA